MKIRTGKLEKRAMVGLLLRAEDASWKLPQNVPFHEEAFIQEVIGNRYKVFTRTSRILVVGRDQIKPLPFDSPSVQMCLINGWKAYIEMSLRQYLGYLRQQFTIRSMVKKRGC